MSRHGELWGCLSNVCIIGQEASEISERVGVGVMKKERVVQIKSDEKSFNVGERWWLKEVNWVAK